MHPILRLYEDTISGGVAALKLPAHPRMIFVVHGTATIDGKSLGDGETSQGQVWHGEGAAAIAAGKDGVTLWRFELTPAGSSGDTIAGPGVRSEEKLAAVLETMPPGELLLRGDSVGFRPAAAPSSTAMGAPASAACSKAASASTPTAARPPTAPAAPGTRPASIRCSRRPPPTGRPASSG